ncbi:Flp family type IVb pilin [Cohaesibacter gelatinilyticus]|uniref:Pilus assembly protein Flp/PilA n=1 Tax=Cohaesibacter gelatinilyticus TaxID=372072 RepID=A0A285PHS9_9HYPH|nr:Flp family type IVb pilin [Cohaesibacter gelatinilyticus]SNZ20797.1 pilus assembly protein Flp/PilA [Cohaesibacter gelatinilyticus]
MVQMKLSILKQFCDDESGATALEYGIVIGLISVAIIATMGPVVEQLTDLLGLIETAVEGV